MTSVHSSIFRPRDLAMIKRALDKVCSDHTIAQPSGEERRIAADLIHAFQRGVRREQDLVDSYDRMTAH